jgi:hypothetical protein
VGAASAGGRRDRLLELGIVAAAALIALVSACPYHSGANDASRLATVESLVDYHTLAINQSRWFPDAACDKIKIPGGPYYSDKPPTLALLLAVPYFALHQAFGFRAAAHEEVFYYLAALLCSGSAYVVAVWCVYRLGRALGLSPGWAAALTASFGLATVAPVYARNVNSNLPTLAAALGVLLNVVALPAGASAGRGGAACFRGPSEPSGKHDDSEGPRKHGARGEFGRLLLIGALGGFAYALEQPTGGLLLAAGAAAAAVQLRRPSAVVWVGLAALPWMALHHAVIYSYAGTLGPPNADPAFFDYPGSQFDAHNLTGRWNHAGPAAFAAYAFLLLFGGRGFVLCNPTLLLAAPAAAWAFRPWHGQLAARGTGRTVTACFGAWGLGVWLIYAALSNNFGGYCCSIRWLVPLLAPACYWLALLLRDLPRYRIDFYILSGWGAALAAYFWIYGPFGAFDYLKEYPYVFWSITAVGLLTWAGCLGARAARGAAPPR